MSQEEAKQLGFALIAVLIVLVIIGGLISVYFYTPSKNGDTHSVIDGKKQAEELSEQVNAMNQRKLEATTEVATTSY